MRRRNRAGFSGPRRAALPPSAMRWVLVGDQCASALGSKLVVSVGTRSSSCGSNLSRLCWCLGRGLAVMRSTVSLSCFARGLCEPQVETRRARSLRQYLPKPALLSEAEAAMKALPCVSAGAGDLRF